MKRYNIEDINILMITFIIGLANIGPNSEKPNGAVKCKFGSQLSQLLLFRLGNYPVNLRG